MPQVKIVARNFMDMVASLPALKLDKLYENSFICEAILRSLPPLAKKYVLQLLYLDGPVPAKSLEEWVLPDGVSKHKVAIDRLIQLRIITETVDRICIMNGHLVSLNRGVVDNKKKEATYLMTPTFQRNLQKHIVHGGVLPREPMPSNITVRLPSLEDLDAYALKQWESFLLHLINSADAETSTNISSSMMKIFQRGLLGQKDDREPPKLTASGFQFLDHGVDTADLISFLLELSFHVTGKAYNLNTLNDIQRSIIKDLADLGLVKLQQGRKESWFIPTKLATNLSISLADTSSRKQGFVVVETNFRMYAYSTSKLHCEILRLFSKIEYQLPNLIVGAITKESLYKALLNGITADQAMSFLQQNAHPRVAERTPSVPENVTDQIRLWEADLNRVEMTPAHYYDEFPSRDVFEAACNFAREYGGLLWENSKKMRIVVKAEIFSQMKEFLRSQRQ
ncbi:transcription factor-related [Striga asiatica]|uniref:RNA polymerase II transcription factor B subunit 2 n=1 Tax=Striga asiatica TaxID=4170 RepID=A0A5A7P354_STRAF|nr:transcription factor-related [Striga asiatica]